MVLQRTLIHSGLNKWKGLSMACVSRALCQRVGTGSMICHGMGIWHIRLNGIEHPETAEKDPWKGGERMDGNGCTVAGAMNLYDPYNWTGRLSASPLFSFVNGPISVKI